MYDSHMHTPLCKHARGEPGEYAQAGYERGLQGIILTCHNPAPDWWSPSIRMRLDEYPTYREMVLTTQAAWKGKLDVRLGLECDYIPGMESWLESLLAEGSLDYILGSVHTHLTEYRERFFNGNYRDFEVTYFEHLAQSAESGFFHALAHPDLVKNCSGSEWDVKASLDTIRRALDRIAKTGVAMELNTSGLLKRIREMNPGEIILREMQVRGIPVVIGSDSHEPKRVGENFNRAQQVLLECGYTKVRYYIEGKPVEYDLGMGSLVSAGPG